MITFTKPTRDGLLLRSSKAKETLKILVKKDKSILSLITKLMNKDPLT